MQLPVQQAIQQKVKHAVFFPKAGCKGSGGLPLKLYLSHRWGNCKPAVPQQPVEGLKPARPPAASNRECPCRSVDVCSALAPLEYRPGVNPDLRPCRVQASR